MVDFAGGSQRAKRAFTALWIAGLAVFIAALLAYALLGSTTRYMADDYWTAHLVRTTPFWELPGYWYTHWSGRYTFFFLVSLAELAGPGVVPVLPGLALLGLTCASALLAVPWLVRLKLPHPLAVAWLLSALFVFTTVHATPNVLQSLYWQTGMLTYFAPILLSVAYLALVERWSAHPLAGWAWVGWLASGLLAFILAGFSETFVAIQVTAFGLALAWVMLLPAGRRWRAWLGLGLVASLIGMAVMIAAPGNLVRLGGNHLHLDAPYVLGTAFKSAWEALVLALRTHLVDAGAALAVPFLAAFMLAPPETAEERRRRLRHIAWALAGAPVAVLVLVAAGNAPAYAVMQSGPPLRSAIIPQAILTAGLMVWGFSAGLAAHTALETTRPQPEFLALTGLAAIVLIGVLALSPGRFLLKAWAQYPVLQSYAAQWDARDRLLWQDARQGQHSVVVQPIGQLDRTLGDLRAEPDFWINQRAAEYYGLNSISAK